MPLDSKSPTGPIETRWDRHRFSLKLVNPANKRKHTVIVVGTGLAGAINAGDLTLATAVSDLQTAINGVPLQNIAPTITLNQALDILVGAAASTLAGQVGEAIGGECRIGLDLVVEIDVGLDRLGLDGRVGLGISGEGRLE